jgi:hypothetical protein
LSDLQVLKMARILHDCYGAQDLVLHLLCEHDHRTNGKLAAIYMGQV